MARKWLLTRFTGKMPPKAPKVAAAVAGKKKSAEPKSRALQKAPKPKKVTKQTAQEMMDLLCRTYPDADCELKFESNFQLLISVILSAQTTDVSVNKVTPLLFKRFPTAKALATA